MTLISMNDNMRVRPAEDRINVILTGLIKAVSLEASIIERL